MITKPRNKYLLWNGKIQLANYPQPILKKDMVGFIKINSLTGTVVHGQPSLYDEIYQKSLNESEAYWKKRKERK